MVILAGIQAQGPWLRGHVTLPVGFLFQGGETTTIYEGECLEGPNSRLLVSLAGFNPQDSPGGEGSLSSLCGRV